MVTSSHRSIYRMKTHKNHFHNNKSNHVPRTLSGVVKCLSSRATFFLLLGITGQKTSSFKKVPSCLMAILYQLLLKTTNETENH